MEYSSKVNKLSKNSVWRNWKNTLNTWVITVGGFSVLVAILLIFFYLLQEIAPLFAGAEVHEVADFTLLDNENNIPSLYLSLEEQNEIALRITEQGTAIFFSVETGNVIEKKSLELSDNTSISSFAVDTTPNRTFAIGLSNGSAVVQQHNYKYSYSDSADRTIKPEINTLYQPVVDTKGHALTQIALRNASDKMSLVALTDDGRLVVSRFTKKESFLTGGVTLKKQSAEIGKGFDDIERILIDLNQEWVLLFSKTRLLSIIGINDLTNTTNIKEFKKLLPDNENIADVTYLLGGLSIIVSGDKGTVTQWFMTGQGEETQLVKVRSFTGATGNLNHINLEQRRKGFSVVSKEGQLSLFNSTANRYLGSWDLGSNSDVINNVALSPRANRLLVEKIQGTYSFWQIDNEHPEVSWQSLWQKVWYESYDEPEYVWQSSSASNDFEPKYSLSPLAFGTLKAAFYAMLLAAPLAICSAIFTAYFMAPSLRRKIKPLIELMEALPTVILGFLAGLWLAPFMEKNLTGIFSLFIILPVGLLFFAWVYSQLPEKYRSVVPKGWQAIVMIPVVIGLSLLCFSLSGFFEVQFFGGDMRHWVTNQLGISFDQRNAMVVGVAMGFAVIPTIFSIAEDAIFSVPEHLSHGSLALGATPWQTLTGVVLPTASPGIFSGLMIGMGRAVGETMIVLMATGNTPIMDMNIFEGMRTLSANIAVEIPEAEVNSTHYRILFLAAFVLFMFTFVVNTAAEIIRQRLRVKYSSL